MKNFEEFVSHIVRNWRKEKKTILESAGLGEISNRELGDKSEEYVKNKIERLIPRYKAFLTNGSQTPADIFSFGRRHGYWHIMLIQVKSSRNKDDIYTLTDNDKKVFTQFSNFVKKEIPKFDLFNEYSEKPIVISRGYVSVLSNETRRGIQHNVIDSILLGITSLNSVKLDLTIIRVSLIKTHISIPRI